MQFKTNSKSLLRACKQAIGATSQGALPILEMFLLEAGNGLKITASNGDIHISTSVQDVEITDAGSVCIPAKLITDLVATLDGDVDVTADGIRITVRSGGSHYEITGEDADQFITTAIPEGKQIADIRTHFPQLLTCVGDDDMRIAMTGIGVFADSVVATNAHKLISFAIKTESPSDIVIPADIARLSLSLGEDVTTKVSGNSISFSDGTTTISGRLINAKYPNVNAVIPQNNQIAAKVSKGELVRSLKQVLLFAPASTSVVTLVVTADKIVISSSDPDRGVSGDATIGCEANEDITIGFNAKHLLSLCATIKDDNLVINMSSPTRAALLYGGDFDQTALIMPVVIV